ncbi:nitronate monooxygenase [Gordonia sp. CPCC 206044]|uniref:NAD(P)H-dependent flavin oxidoreductase n=1 Tax=Gordonia sp. CPCC 206044 TaxID=3140793 RepID=UPI003AF34982
MSNSWSAFVSRFRIPLIAAPMTLVSGLELVAAAAGAGIGGGFPVHNASSPQEMGRWLSRTDRLRGPVIPNVVVHRTNTRLADDLSVIAASHVPAVITSVGNPQPVVGPLHDAGILVLADVGSMRHVDRAIAAGADGLVLLTAGAGGQTGWANPFAFAHAVRKVWDGPMILAGGISDGRGLLAAIVAGFDLVYMGTPFIATVESSAPRDWKDAVVAAGMDDIELTSEVTGLPTSMIRAAATSAATPAIDGFEMARLGASDHLEPESGEIRYSAGHSAAGVDEVLSVVELVDRVESQLLSAAKDLRISER